MGKDNSTGTPSHFDAIDSWSVFSAVSWEQLPDLGLYMDQVITYIEQQCQPLYRQAHFLTPAMVNNYVKSGLITRPVAKKYGRTQLAQLMMICTLKLALTMDEMDRLLKSAAPEPAGIEFLYRDFCATQLVVWDMMTARRDQGSPLHFALEAAASKILCGDKLAASH